MNDESHTSVQYRVFSVTTSEIGECVIAESPTWYCDYRAAEHEARQATTTHNEQLRIEARLINMDTDTEEGFYPDTDVTLYKDTPTITPRRHGDTPGLTYRTCHVMLSHVGADEEPVCFVVESPFWRDSLHGCYTELRDAAGAGHMQGHCLSSKIEVRETERSYNESTGTLTDVGLCTDEPVYTEELLSTEYCMVLAAYVVKHLNAHVRLQCWGCAHALSDIQGHDLCTKPINEQVTMCWEPIVESIIMDHASRKEFFCNLMRSISEMEPSPSTQFYQKYLTSQYLINLTAQSRAQTMHYVMAYVANHSAKLLDSLPEL